MDKVKYIEIDRLGVRQRMEYVVSCNSCHSKVVGKTEEEVRERANKLGYRVRIEEDSEEWGTNRFELCSFCTAEYIKSEEVS